MLFIERSVIKNPIVHDGPVSIVNINGDLIIDAPITVSNGNLFILAKNIYTTYRAKITTLHKNIFIQTTNDMNIRGSDLVSAKSLRAQAYNNLIVGNDYKSIVSNEIKYMLHKAAKKGNLVEVKRLVENCNMDVNKRNITGATPLHQAAYFSCIQMVQYLISKQAEIDAVNVHNITPLHCAAEKGYLETVKCLIANNANINAKSTLGWTPLDYAINSGCLSVVQYLTNLGMPLNNIERMYHFSVKVKRTEEISLWFVNSYLKSKSSEYIINALSYILKEMKENSHVPTHINIFANYYTWSLCEAVIDFISNKIPKTNIIVNEAHKKAIEELQIGYQNRLNYLAYSHISGLKASAGIYKLLTKYFGVDTCLNILEYYLPNSLAMSRVSILKMFNSVHVLNMFNSKSNNYEFQLASSNAIISMSKNNNHKKIISALQQQYSLNAIEKNLKSVNKYLDSLNTHYVISQLDSNKQASSAIDKMVNLSGGINNCMLASYNLQKKISSYMRDTKNREKQLHDIFKREYKNIYGNYKDSWARQLFAMKKYSYNNSDIDWKILDTIQTKHVKYTIQHKHCSSKKITVARYGSDSKISISANENILDREMIVIIAAQTKQKADLLNTKTININCSDIFSKNRLFKILRTLLQKLDPKLKLVMNGVINTPRI